jgi:hypothetical protein
MRQKTTNRDRRKPAISFDSPLNAGKTGIKLQASAELLRAPCGTSKIAEISRKVTPRRGRGAGKAANSRLNPAFWSHLEIAGRRYDRDIVGRDVWI